MVRPSPSLTPMGGEDDVIARSARLAPWARCSGSRPRALSRDRLYGCAGVSVGPLEPPLRHQAAMHHSRPVRQPVSVLAELRRGRGQAGRASRSVDLYRMRSLTAVLKRRREQPRSTETSHWRFRSSKPICWACQDLNQRPHPSQQSGAYRHATLRSCRSCATVEGEVMRSYNWPLLHGAVCRISYVRRTLAKISQASSDLASRLSVM